MAYRADIEIAVRGAQDLKRLQNEISTASKLVNQLNQYIETFGGPSIVRSVRNLKDTVSEAATAFNKAALGTDEATIAAKKYIEATAELNAGLRERRELLSSITEQERKARLARSGITETTQYGGPIGPGQVSPVALSSRVEGRIQSILQERQGRKELNAVLEDQFEKERQLQNNRLDEKAAQVQAALDKQAAATAETAAQTAKLNDRTQEFTARTDQAARAARAQTAEYLRQQRVLKELRKTQATAPAGGFPVEGPMASPGFRGMQRNVGKFGENLALGAGFPLLFGGGPGAVAGSVLGSFVGTGFGGQILGGAIGQVLDQTLIKIRDIGNAVKQLNFDTLTESGIRFSSEIRTQVDLLLQVGDALTAQKLASQEVARETGTLPGVTEDVANSVNILNDSWRKTINAVSTTAGIIAAPLSVALAGILELVNAIFRAVNTIFSLIGTGIKTAAEFVIQLLGGKDAVDFINNSINRLNSGLSEATAKAAEFRNTINQSVVRSDIELRAARGLTPGITTEEKITNINVETQKELNLLAQDEADARIKIRQENARASAETVEGLLKQNAILFRNKKEAIEINAQRQVTTEIQRNQAELDRKAAQELERQRKELERMAKMRMEQMDVAQRNYVLAEAEIGVLTAIGDEGKAQAEFDKMRTERMYTFSELLKKALSDEEREALVQTQYLKALAAQVELDNKLLDIQKKQTTELYNQLDVAGILSAKRQAGFSRAAGLEGTAFNPNLNLFAISEKDQALERTRLELEKLLDPITQVTVAAEGIGSAFSTSFKGIVSGTMTAQEALAGFFQNIADQFLDMAAQIIAKWIQLTILNSILKLFPSSPTGSAASGGFTLPGGAGFAQGFGMESLITLPGRAAGGPVSAGSPYIVGERGPELFVPGRSGSIVPNDKLGSDNVNVVVNVDAKGTSVQGNDQQGNQLGRAISAAVQQELIKQKRPGGLLA